MVAGGLPSDFLSERRRKLTISRGAGSSAAWSIKVRIIVKTAAKFLDMKKLSLEKIHGTLVKEVSGGDFQLPHTSPPFGRLSRLANHVAR